MELVEGPNNLLYYIFAVMDALNSCSLWGKVGGEM